MFKYVGNVVIPGKQVKSIKIDKRIQKVYDEKEKKLRDEGAGQKEEQQQ